MELNKDTWNSFYVNENTPWDAGNITTPLKNYIDSIENKDIKILIPGAGNAHEGEYIYRKGFKNIFICDWAPNAFDAFKKRLPEFPEDQLVQADFFKLNDTFDLIIEQTFFCALDPTFRPAYGKQMGNLLTENGSLVGLLFDKPFDPNSGPPFGGDKKEYLQYFEPYFKNINIEPCLDSIKPRLGKELFIEISNPI